METIRINGLQELHTAAESIIKLLPGNRVVALWGQMGAGKTTLVREIARLLGVQDDVTSPTFAIVNQYLTAGGDVINHFDFYRIERLEEAFDMGYEEYFFGGEVCLVEWPEKIEVLLPKGTLDVRIEVADGDNRIIHIGQ